MAASFKCSALNGVQAGSQARPQTKALAHLAVAPISSSKRLPTRLPGTCTVPTRIIDEAKPIQETSPAGRVLPMATASPYNGNGADSRPTVVITGASSGLGLQTARVLAQSGKWHVIMACRDFVKAELAAQRVGIPKGSYTVMHLDLAALESVRQFVRNFRATGRSLDVLVANAAVYLPNATEPTYTADGFELSVGTNHLGHFLLCNLLLEDLKKSSWPNRRMIIVGSITGNANTLAGKIPPQANLGDLSGMAAGLRGENTMIDGGKFIGAKAYKDAKLCNMLTMREFHRRFHNSTGIQFASLYPGCIATTGLFREHYTAFKVLFPLFQKNVTKGYVSEEEAGERLAKVVSDPAYNTSGAYWSWQGSNASGAFVNELSDEAQDASKAEKLWELSEKLVGLTPSKTPAPAAAAAAAR